MILDSISAVVPEKYHKLVKQFVKFGITGAIGAVVDFGSYNLLTRGFDWDTVISIGGMNFIAANLISVFLAIVSNFILNKYWTFRNHEHGVLKQWSGYFALNTVTFLLNQVLTSFFAFQVPLLLAIFGSQTDNVAKALAIGLILFVNFAGSKLVIFRVKKPTTAAVKQPY